VPDVVDVARSAFGCCVIDTNTANRTSELFPVSVFICGLGKRGFGDRAGVIETSRRHGLGKPGRDPIGMKRSTGKPTGVSRLSSSRRLIIAAPALDPTLFAGPGLALDSGTGLMRGAGASFELSARVKSIDSGYRR